MRDDKTDISVPSDRGDKAPGEPGGKPKERRSRWRIVGWAFLVLIALLGVGRLYLPHFVRWYVNRTIDRNPLYEGKIGDVDIHLWRGAYAIHDVRLLKTTGNVPVPLFSAQRVEFSVEWKQLVHGKVVGKMVMDQPELNFVDAPDPSETQTGAGGPWLQMIRDLFPFKINSAKIHDGSVHFRTYTGKEPVDVFLSRFDATIDNLTNIRDETTPMITTVSATALAMDQAKFEYKMKLDPFSYRPTFHMALRLLGLDVTKINNMAIHYGKFDFERGWFDLVIECDSKEGVMTGYVKPLFRNLKVLSIPKDLKQDNPIQFFWEALVGLGSKILSNPPRDQFGTLIPFSADASGKTTTDLLATIGNVLRNAFIRAYLPKLQSGAGSFEGMQFEPASPADPDAIEAAPFSS